MRLDHLFLLLPLPGGRRRKSYVYIFLQDFLIDFFPWRVLPLSSNIFFLHLFPVSIAGLQLTFPSRTRSIRGPAAMVLHIWLRESSSMPDFFFKDSADFQQGLFFCLFFKGKKTWLLCARKKKERVKGLIILCEKEKPFEERLFPSRALPFPNLFGSSFPATGKDRRWLF